MHEPKELDEILERLDNLLFQIESAGEVAEPGTVIEVVPHSSSGKRYARKRRSVAGKNAFEGCGVEGAERHLAAVAAVQRRRLMEQVQGLIQQAEALRRSDDWQAAPPFELGEFETRVEEERQADVEKGLYVDDSPAATFISFAFLGSKGATVSNRKVHAVPGEPSRYPFNFWDTPALCGVKPHFLKSWGWIGDCSILHLSCKRCEKKLWTVPHAIRLPDFMGGGLSQGIRAIEMFRDE